MDAVAEHAPDSSSSCSTFVLIPDVHGVADVHGVRRFVEEASPGERSAVGAVHLFGHGVGQVVVDVAEHPALAGFERLNHAVASIVEMPRGVLVGRVVAAANVAALHAQAQVDPLPTDLEAVFAALDGVWLDRLEIGQVSAGHR